MDIGAWLAGRDITTGAAIVRLGLAALAGGAVGLEREMRRQSAGLRTHIIICLGSTLLTLLSIWMAQTLGKGLSDPTRIAAQIVSGIGFLGAGAIMKIGNNTKGLTTAASIWGVAALGMAIGSLVGVAIAAFIVKSLPLGALRWLVVVVVTYAAVAMLRSAAIERANGALPSTSSP